MTDSSPVNRYLLFDSVQQFRATDKVHYALQFADEFVKSLQRRHRNISPGFASPTTAGTSWKPGVGDGMGRSSHSHSPSTSPSSCGTQSSGGVGVAAAPCSSRTHRDDRSRRYLLRTLEEVQRYLFLVERFLYPPSDAAAQWSSTAPSGPEVGCTGPCVGAGGTVTHSFCPRVTGFDVGDTEDAFHSPLSLHTSAINDFGDIDSTPWESPSPTGSLWSWPVEVLYQRYHVVVALDFSKSTFAVSRNGVVMADRMTSAVEAVLETLRTVRLTRESEYAAIARLVRDGFKCETTQGHVLSQVWRPQVALSIVLVNTPPVDEQSLTVIGGIPTALHDPLRQRSGSAASTPWLTGALPSPLQRPPGGPMTAARAPLFPPGVVPLGAADHHAGLDGTAAAGCSGAHVRFETTIPLLVECTDDELDDPTLGGRLAAVLQAYETHFRASVANPDAEWADVPIAHSMEQLLKMVPESAPSCHSLVLVTNSSDPGPGEMVAFLQGMALQKNIIFSLLTLNRQQSFATPHFSSLTRLISDIGGFAVYVDFWMGLATPRLNVDWCRRFEGPRCLAQQLLVQLVSRFPVVIPGISKKYGGQLLGVATAGRRPVFHSDSVLADTLLSSSVLDTLRAIAEARLSEGWSVLIDYDRESSKEAHLYAQCHHLLQKGALTLHYEVDIASPIIYRRVEVSGTTALVERFLRCHAEERLCGSAVEGERLLWVVYLSTLRGLFERWIRAEQQMMKILAVAYAPRNRAALPDLLQHSGALGVSQAWHANVQVVPLCLSFRLLPPAQVAGVAEACGPRGDAPPATLSSLFDAVLDRALSATYWKCATGESFAYVLRAADEARGAAPLHIVQCFVYGAGDSPFLRVAAALAEVRVSFFQSSAEQRASCAEELTTKLQGAVSSVAEEHALLHPFSIICSVDSEWQRHPRPWTADVLAGSSSGGTTVRSVGFGRSSATRDLLVAQRAMWWRRSELLMAICDGSSHGTTVRQRRPLRRSAGEEAPTVDRLLRHCTMIPLSVSDVWSVAGGASFRWVLSLSEAEPATAATTLSYLVLRRVCCGFQLLHYVSGGSLAVLKRLGRWYTADPPRRDQPMESSPSSGDSVAGSPSWLSKTEVYDVLEIRAEVAAAGELGSVVDGVLGPHSTRPRCGSQLLIHRHVVGYVSVAERLDAERGNTGQCPGASVGSDVPRDVQITTAVHTFASLTGGELLPLPVSALTMATRSNQLARPPLETPAVPLSEQLGHRAHAGWSIPDASASSATATTVQCTLETVLRHLSVSRSTVLQYELPAAVRAVSPGCTRRLREALRHVIWCLGASHTVAPLAAVAADVAAQLIGASGDSPLQGGQRPVLVSFLRPIEAGQLTVLLVAEPRMESSDGLAAGGGTALPTSSAASLNGGAAVDLTDNAADDCVRVVVASLDQGTMSHSLRRDCAVWGGRSGAGATPPSEREQHKPAMWETDEVMAGPACRIGQCVGKLLSSLVRIFAAREVLDHCDAVVEQEGPDRPALPPPILADIESLFSEFGDFTASVDVSHLLYVLDSQSSGGGDGGGKTVCGRATPEAAEEVVSHALQSIGGILKPLPGSQVVFRHGMTGSVLPLGGKRAKHRSKGMARSAAGVTSTPSRSASVNRASTTARAVAQNYDSPSGWVSGAARTLQPLSELDDMEEGEGGDHLSISVVPGGVAVKTSKRLSTARTPCAGGIHHSVSHGEVLAEASVAPCKSPRLWHNDALLSWHTESSAVRPEALHVPMVFRVLMEVTEAGPRSAGALGGATGSDPPGSWSCWARWMPPATVAAASASPWVPYATHGTARGDGDGAEPSTRRCMTLRLFVRTVPSDLLELCRSNFRPPAEVVRSMFQTLLFKMGENACEAAPCAASFPQARWCGGKRCLTAAEAGELLARCGPATHLPDYLEGVLHEVCSRLLERIAVFCLSSGFHSTVFASLRSLVTQPAADGLQRGTGVADGADEGRRDAPVSAANWSLSDSLPTAGASAAGYPASVSSLSDLQLSDLMLSPGSVTADARYRGGRGHGADALQLVSQEDDRVLAGVAQVHGIREFISQCIAPAMLSTDRFRVTSFAMEFTRQASYFGCVDPIEATRQVFTRCLEDDHICVVPASQTCFLLLPNRRSFGRRWILVHLGSDKVSFVHMVTLLSYEEGMHGGAAAGGALAEMNSRLCEQLRAVILAKTVQISQLHLLKELRDTQNASDELIPAGWSDQFHSATQTPPHPAAPPAPPVATTGHPAEPGVAPGGRVTALEGSSYVDASAWNDPSLPPTAPSGGAACNRCAARASSFYCKGFTVLELPLHYKLQHQSPKTMARISSNSARLELIPIYNREQCFVVPDEVEKDVFHYLRILFVRDSSTAVPPDAPSPRLMPGEICPTLVVQLYSAFARPSVQRVLDKLADFCYQLAVQELQGHFNYVHNKEISHNDLVFLQSVRKDLVAIDFTTQPWHEVDRRELMLLTCVLALRALKEYKFKHVEVRDEVAHPPSKFLLHYGLVQRPQVVVTPTLPAASADPTAQTTTLPAADGVSDGNPDDCLIFSGIHLPETAPSRAPLLTPSPGEAPGLPAILQPTGVFVKVVDGVTDVLVSCKVSLSCDALTIQCFHTRLPSERYGATESEVTAAQQLGTCAREVEAQLRFHFLSCGAGPLVRLVALPSLFDELVKAAEVSAHSADSSMLRLYRHSLDDVTPAVLPYVVETVAGALHPFAPLCCEQRHGDRGPRHVAGFPWWWAERTSSDPLADQCVFYVTCGFAIAEAEPESVPLLATRVSHVSHPDFPIGATVTLDQHSAFHSISVALRDEMIAALARVRARILLRISLNDGLTIMIFNVRDVESVLRLLEAVVGEGELRSRLLRDVLLQRMGSIVPSSFDESHLARMCCGDETNVAPMMPLSIAGEVYRRRVNPIRFPPSRLTGPSAEFALVSRRDEAADPALPLRSEWEMEELAFKIIVEGLHNRGLIVNYVFTRDDAVKVLYDECPQYSWAECQRLVCDLLDDGYLCEECFSPSVFSSTGLKRASASALAAHPQIYGKTDGKPVTLRICHTDGIPEDTLIASDYHRHLQMAHVMLEARNARVTAADSLRRFNALWQRRPLARPTELATAICLLQLRSNQVFGSRVPDFSLRSERYSPHDAILDQALPMVSTQGLDYCRSVDTTLAYYVRHLEKSYPTMRIVKLNPADSNVLANLTLLSRLRCRYGKVVTLTGEVVEFSPHLYYGVVPIADFIAERRQRSPHAGEVGTASSSLQSIATSSQRHGPPPTAASLHHTHAQPPLSHPKTGTVHGAGGHDDDGIARSGVFIVEVGLQVVHFALDFFVVGGPDLPSGEAARLAADFMKEFMFSSVLYDLTVSRLLHCVKLFTAVLPCEQPLAVALANLVKYYPSPPHYSLNIVARHDITDPRVLRLRAASQRRGLSEVQAEDRVTFLVPSATDFLIRESSQERYYYCGLLVLESAQLFVMVGTMRDVVQCSRMATDDLTELAERATQLLIARLLDSTLHARLRTAWDKFFAITAPVQHVTLDCCTDTADVDDDAHASTFEEFDLVAANTTKISVDSDAVAALQLLPVNWMLLLQRSWGFGARLAPPVAEWRCCGVSTRYRGHVWHLAACEGHSSGSISLTSTCHPHRLVATLASECDAEHRCMLSVEVDGYGGGLLRSITLYRRAFGANQLATVELLDDEVALVEMVLEQLLSLALSCVQPTLTGAPIPTDGGGVGLVA